MKRWLCAGLITLVMAGVLHAQSRKASLTPVPFIFPAPTEVSCDVFLGTNALVTWAPVTAAAGYQVQWSALAKDRSQVIEHTMALAEPMLQINVEGIEMLMVVVRALDRVTDDVDTLQGLPQGRWSPHCSVPIPLE